MLRVLILASLCAVINASLLPNFVLDYPRSLRRLFESKHAAEEKEDERGVCKTEECKLIAQIIKGSMDETTDPCDDFYEYACGNWSKVNPLPENKTDWSLWDMVSERVNRQIKEILTGDAKPSDFFAVKLAKKWYKSCIDTDAIEKRGVEPILTTLWRHGGWPLIMEDGEWDEDVYNWQIVDDQFARLIGFNAFYDLRSHSLTYGGNVTILVSTPHLPLGVQKFLPFALLAALDSSDENNESGEGSQEKGSRERGQQQQNEENSDEEQTEEEDEENEIEDKDESDWQTAEEDEEEELRKKNVVARKHRKRLNHMKRKHDEKEMANQHIRRKGTKKRTKRDLMNQKVLRKLSRHLKKADKHKVHHSVKGKLAKHSHIVHNKLNKNNNNKKKISRTNKEGHKLHKKNRRIAKRLGHSKGKNNKKEALEKHAHERKMKKLSRKEMETKIHAVKHHKHQKIANHKVHHATNKMSTLKHKKMPLSDSTKDEDNVTDISIDDENEDSNNNKEEDENKSNNDEDDEENDDEDDGSDEKEDNDDDNDNDSDDDDNDNDSDDDDDNDNDNDDDDSEEFDEELMEEMAELYRNHILNVSIVLSKGRGVEIPREQMLEDIDNLIEFITKLGMITYLQDDDEELMNTTLAELQTHYESLGPTTPINKINWVRKIQKIFTEAGVDDIDEDTELTIVNPTYLEHLHALLSETPSKVLVNYVHWLFISKAIIAGPQELLDLINQWDTNVLSSSERELRCLEVVQLSNVAGYEYVQRHFKEDLAKTARDMIDDIQKEVEYLVKESKWMDDDTRHFILDKLVHMKNWIGYPDWYRNTTIVKRYFRGLTIGPSFYENVINYVRYFRWKSLRQILGDENEKEVNDMLDPLELNAFFMPTENSISITAVDLQSPFFALNRPWYVNFGIIGLIMGHEVNHGFDDSGHLFDKEGNQMEWLSAMAQAYDERAMCFVNQYNEYSIVKGENYTIEDYGNRTAGENIADTMGMHAVFRAYKRRERECGKTEPALPGLEKFSNDQLFFLSFANLWCESEDREGTIRSAKYDVHSTARLRVIGPASNSNDFAKAFNCPVGSPMNPKRKCNIW